MSATPTVRQLQRFGFLSPCPARRLNSTANWDEYRLECCLQTIKSGVSQLTVLLDQTGIQRIDLSMEV